jgi:hypothetical protein
MATPLGAIVAKLEANKALFVTPLPQAGRHWFTKRMVDRSKGEPDAETAATELLMDAKEFSGARRCYRYRDQKIADYARRAGLAPKDVLAWIEKISKALKARPAAVACIGHLADLRKTGKQWPCVQPHDVLRRRDALERAKALALVLPVWPNAPLPDPDDESPATRGWRAHPARTRNRHGPHKRQLRD